MKTFAVAMMVKNEAGYVVKTLNSVKEYVDSFVIFDTGSTDNTVEEVEKWCETNGKTLYLKRGEFIDFATSRNDLLEFACETAAEPYLLLLDANDEMRGDWTELEAAVNTDIDGAVLRQEWNWEENTITFWNTRLVTNSPMRPKVWQYVGVVHEYLQCLVSKPLVVKLSNIIIFQDRSNDVSKSIVRAETDYNLLQEQLKATPDDARSWFYLARTCDTLGKTQEAINYYRQRIDIRDDYSGERFWSQMGMARNFAALGHHHLAERHYQLAFEIEQRAEPLVELAEWYIREHLLQTAYISLHRACELDEPEQAVLFVDKRIYDYKRWHLMGILAFYCGTSKEGENACRRALKAYDNGIDRVNLEHYLN